MRSSVAAVWSLVNTNTASAEQSGLSRPDEVGIGVIACTIAYWLRGNTRNFGAASENAELTCLAAHGSDRSEEHTSELQSLMRISYAVFCLKTQQSTHHNRTTTHYVLL